MTAAIMPVAYPALSELSRRTDTPKIIISPIFLTLIKDFNFIEFYMREIWTKVIQFFTYTVRNEEIFLVTYGGTVPQKGIALFCGHSQEVLSYKRFQPE